MFSHYLFPKPDTTLSNSKSSRLDLSVPLGSQHNKFFRFFSATVHLITPGTQTLNSTARQDSLQYLPRWERINCQFPTCRYKRQQLPKGKTASLLSQVSRSHSDTPHSVGLLWTGDRPVAETSTWQHKTLSRDIHP
jgi:hypothetical protein